MAMTSTWQRYRVFESKHWICPQAWAKGPLKSGKALAYDAAQS